MWNIICFYILYCLNFLTMTSCNCATMWRRRLISRSCWSSPTETSSASCSLILIPIPWVPFSLCCAACACASATPTYYDYDGRTNQQQCFLVSRLCLFLNFFLRLFLMFICLLLSSLVNGEWWLVTVTKK